MEPEPNEGMNNFLRRVAQVAAIGAAVGAAVAAGRAAARQNGAEPEEPQDVENPDAEQAEHDEFQAREPEPSASKEDELVQQSETRAEEEEPDEEPEQQDEADLRAEQETSDEEREEDAGALEEQHVERSDGQVDSEAAGLIGRALRQVQELTGREAEGVLGLRRDNGDWVVSVEVVELHRVPSSTDVLASYDVVVDGDGELREYRRTGRYIRGRAEAGEQ